VAIVGQIIRSVFTISPTVGSELQQAGNLARLSSSDISASKVSDALKLFSALPDLMLSNEIESAVAQQLFRVLLSYHEWYLPMVMRDDVPGGPALWNIGMPASGGGQLLTLANDEKSMQSLTGRGVRDGGDASVLKTVISGVDAVSQHFPLNGKSSWQGVLFCAGEQTMLSLDKEQIHQLQMWEATLRCEYLLETELDSDTQACPPASDKLAALLARRVKLCFVQMGEDLARDASGRNIVTLTSNDAAALCANAYGRMMVRPADAKQLREMAEGAAGAFDGYALTYGADRNDTLPSAGEKHIPRWNTRVVTTEWMASALRAGEAA